MPDPVRVYDIPEHAHFDYAQRAKAHVPELLETDPVAHQTTVVAIPTKPEYDRLFETHMINTPWGIFEKPPGYKSQYDRFFKIEMLPGVQLPPLFELLENIDAAERPQEIFDALIERLNHFEIILLEVQGRIGEIRKA